MKILKYKENGAISTDMLAKIENGSITCYTREEKEEINSSVLLNIALGLLGIVVGILCRRLSLFFEELFHLKGRYNGNIIELMKACFSGISWLAVATVALLNVITISVVMSKQESSLEHEHVILILGGGPLVMLL